MPVRCRRRSCPGVVAAALCAALAACAVASLLVGTRDLGAAAVLEVLRGTSTDPEAVAVVAGQRVPRTVVGAVAGAALAVGGALAQAHTRNPLADPGLLGVTAGAALGVVGAVSWLGIGSAGVTVWAAFAGAAVATLSVGVVATLASSRRDSGPAALVLAGAAVSALLSAVTGVLLLLDPVALDLYRFWTVGSLGGARGAEALGVVWPFLLAGLLLALAQGRALDVLALGDDAARGLGSGVAGVRVAGVVAVVLLVGAAVSCVGSLGFVGLVAPHLVRRASCGDHRVLLPLAALAGAVLVLAADVVGRVVVQPAELPVGVALGVLGGPAFLVVVARTARRRRGRSRTGPGPVTTTVTAAGAR